MSIILLRGYGSLEAKIADNVDTSRRFTSRIETLTPILTQEPDTAVVFESHYFWDYEPLLSTAIFLRTAGIRNPFYIRVHPGSVQPKLPTEFIIAQWIRDVSDKGIDRPEMKLFLPLAQRNRGHCYSIGFSGTSSDECTFLLQVYP